MGGMLSKDPEPLSLLATGTVPADTLHLILGSVVRSHPAAPPHRTLRQPAGAALSCAAAAAQRTVSVTEPAIGDTTSQGGMVSSSMMRLPDDRFFTLHLRAPGLDVEGYSLLSLDKAEEKGKAAAEAMLERRGLLFFVDAEAMSASPAPLAPQPHPPSASSEVCDFLRGVSRMESGGTREREQLHEKLFTMSGRPPLGAVIVLASHKEGVTADKLREQLGLDALKSGTHTVSIGIVV